MGTGEKSLRSDPGPELRLGREKKGKKKKCEGNRRDKQTKKMASWHRVRLEAV